MSQRVQSYKAPGITVTFDPSVCTHSARCVRGLPAVFDVSRARWIRPDAASVAEVTAQVAACPSGALQVTLTPEGATDAPTE